MKKICISIGIIQAPNYARARSAAKELFRLFELESEELNAIDFKVKLDFEIIYRLFLVLKKEVKSFSGIEFDDITFAYENRPDKTILKNLSLKIKPGK